MDPKKALFLQALANAGGDNAKKKPPKGKPSKGKKGKPIPPKKKGK